jgi:prepilin-type N-terminal cleavage/methylation domain-containing protein
LLHHPPRAGGFASGDSVENKKCYNFEMKKLFSKNTGFTLVELMVVISIIAILTGILTTNFTSSRAKARDAKRISDLGHIQLAIELYFDRCKQYPVPTVVSMAQPGLSAGNLLAQTTGTPPPETTIAPSTPPTVSTLSTSANNGCPAGVTLGSYIANIPVAPNGGTYDYVVNNASKPTDYILHVQLEEYNEVLKDSALTGNRPFDGNFGCHRGANPVYRDYCIGPQ